MTRRVVAIVFATVILSGVPAGALSAQNRGGRRGDGAVRVPPAAAPRATFRGRVTGRITPQAAAPRIFGGRPVVTRFGPRVIAPQPFVPVYSPFFPAPTFYPEPAYVEPVYAAPPVNQSGTNLADEVQRLRQEIEQLRLELSLLAVRQASPPPVAVAPVPPESPRPVTPTTLVFRDGHRQTVLNYAIVGETFWALDEKVAVKIPLSELDLDATQKENRSQGVRFPPAR